MSVKERVIAGLLLAVAVAGGALIPRLLTSPATPLGIAFGPGPGPSVVQAPRITEARDRAASRRATPPPSRTATAPTASPTPAAARPTPAPAASTANPKHAPTPPPTPTTTTPTPTPPPTTTTTPAPTQAPAVSPPSPHPPPQPGGATAPTPTGQQTSGHWQRHRGHAGWRPPVHWPPSPRGHLGGPNVPQRRRNPGHDLPGSGHGTQPPQAPSFPVGHHHRGVGHLAPPPTGATPAARHTRPQARTRLASRCGQGRHGPPPQVAQGHGHHGRGWR